MPTLQGFLGTQRSPRGASNKFWEVTVSGDSLTARWGRIGTSGQTKEKTFASNKEAQVDADKQFKKKVSKGYVEV